MKQLCDDKDSDFLETILLDEGNIMDDQEGRGKQLVLSLQISTDRFDLYI